MRIYGIPCKMVRVIADIYAGFECAVVEGNVTSDWFMIKSGVKQGYIMLGFLFLLGLGHEEGNSRQEKKDKVEFHITAGGP